MKHSPPPRNRAVEDAFYHSGFQKEANFVPTKAEAMLASEEDTRNLIRVVFKTVKYTAPLPIGITTSIFDWRVIAPMTWHEDGSWQIELSGDAYAKDFEFKIRLGNIWMEGENRKVRKTDNEIHLTDEDVYLAHKIEFSTDRWRPNHLVTLRTPVDGWYRDLFGRFHTNRDGSGKWVFELDRSRFRESEMEVSFVLDRQHRIRGKNLHISLDENERKLWDDDIDFGISPSAYVHAYDNLVAEESLWEQRILPPRSRPSAQKVYDVIVVGSGIAGGTLADALSDQGLSTLVLEAGGLGYPVHMNEFPRSQFNPVSRDQLDSFSTDESEFVGGLIFNLGGRSNYWSGIIPEMQLWEFRTGPWPDAVRDALLGTEEQLGVYKEANELMTKQVSMGPYQDRVVKLLEKDLGNSYKVEILPRSMHQPDLDCTGKLQNVLRRSCGAFSSSDLLLESLGYSTPAGEQYLDLALHHLTTKIEPAGDFVLAHCQDLIANRSCSYKARHLVMCCGSVETPRLAIQSGLSDPNTKMGRGLTDHAAYVNKWTPKLPTTGPLGWLGNVDGHAKIMVRPANPLKDPFNIEVLINSSYWDVRHRDPDLWRNVRPNEATVGIKFIFASTLDDWNWIRPQGEGKKPVIHVGLNRHAKPYLDRIVKARNDVFIALGVPSANLSTEWLNDEWHVGDKGSVQHSGGSMRMSDNGTGVVDENLKLLAYDNIHCCDASVFPSIPAANPSLTIAALALRLAKHLAQLRKDLNK
jgi:GMC oxidoreductase